MQSSALHFFLGGLKIGTVVFEFQFDMTKIPGFTHRIAQPSDVRDIMELMNLSIELNMRTFLSQAQIEANKESMGLDQTLIEDRTYFVVEAEKNGKTVIIGCGGWGKRRTLYGGNHTIGRDDDFANPEIEPARIRAMYTHPEWVRQGVGSLLLDVAENAAREAGFKVIELGSTLPGEPLYLARGYVELLREERMAANGHKNIIIKMSKSLV